MKTHPIRVYLQRVLQILLAIGSEFVPHHVIYKHDFVPKLAEFYKYSVVPISTLQVKPFFHIYAENAHFPRDYYPPPYLLNSRVDSAP